MTEHALLPCPFCGGPAADNLGWTDRPVDMYSVGCSVCGAVAQWAYTTDGAMAFWNRRWQDTGTKK
jgi:Lar family restriction alleviation protein